MAPAWPPRPGLPGIFSITPATALYNATADKAEKAGGLFLLRGKNQLSVSQVSAGDLGALSKLQFTNSGDTLCDAANPVRFAPIAFPAPCISKAISAAKQGEEDKVFSGLSRLQEEDPSIRLEKNAETTETILWGQGELHLDVIRNKLASKFGANANLSDPKIPYRETIRKTVSCQGRHKKQSGGSGQYGDVHIKFAPSAQEFEFSEELFGGSVPKQYVPAVEKGLLECMERGPLAGCKVQNVKATLYDGSYHPVDSNEAAFKIAASLAFKKGIAEAKPVLLEPIMKLEISVPDDFVGAVMGDLPTRRGAVMGMDPQPGGGQILHAEAPQAELFDYAIALRSMTQARGSFTMEFARYEEVPAMNAQKIIEAHKAEEEA